MFKNITPVLKRDRARNNTERVDEKEKSQVTEENIVC
jgi:hypothetical protein